MDHGLAYVVPQFRRAALTTWWCQRVCFVFTVLTVLLLLVL